MTRTKSKSSVRKCSGLPKCLCTVYHPSVNLHTGENKKKVSIAVAAYPATQVQLPFAKESQPVLDESQQKSSSHIFHVFFVVRFVVNVWPIP